MSDQTQQLRDEIVALGRSLFDRGFSVGSAGNLSARIPGGYLMTPTNSSLGRLDPEKLSVLNEAWEHVGGERPSKEVFMHRALYEARPDAQAIVHLHSPYVTAWSCLPEAETEGLPPLTPYFVMRLGRTVPMVPYHRPGDPAMAAGIRAAGELSPGVILANHGSVVAGASLHDAANAAEELEASAQLALLLHGRNPRPLTEAEIVELGG